MKKTGNSETGCCPRFDPKPWDKKEIIFKDKMFLKDHVTCFFYMPMGFSKAMVKYSEMIKNAGALLPKPLMLYDCNSPWRADFYIGVGKNVPGAQMERISGKFLSRVYEGSFKDSGKWMNDMKAYVAAEGRKAGKIYYYYTMCPACAKHYGKNYTVLLAKVG